MSTKLSPKPYSAGIARDDAFGVSHLTRPALRYHADLLLPNLLELFVTENSKTPLLDRISLPRDLKNLVMAPNKTLAAQLANELRSETIDAVAKTGGHLGAGLGVIELTVALHCVFDTPADRLIWDVGHQSYPHKILTGRRNRIRTLRQGGGLSGFTKRAESEYDPFGAAHSST